MGIWAMLLRAVSSGVEVQQTVAVVRLVNLLYDGLRQEGAGVMRSSVRLAMTDEMTTLPILPPSIEAQLASGISIVMPGGSLRHFAPAQFIEHLVQRGRLSETDLRPIRVALWQ